MPEEKQFEKIKIKSPENVPESDNFEKIDRSFKRERPIEKNVEKQTEQKKEGKAGESIGGIVSQGNQQSRFNARQKEIEKVLSSDLNDIYLQMTPDKQKEFKEKGEETAKKINEMLETAKIKVKKVMVLIRKWLAIIPGVNKFFLEQETKLKTDEILKLKGKNQEF